MFIVYTANELQDLLTIGTCLLIIGLSLGIIVGMKLKKEGVK